MKTYIICLAIYATNFITIMCDEDDIMNVVFYITIHIKY